RCPQLTMIKDMNNPQPLTGERVMSGFKCLECGRKFKTVRAAERASMNGCPKCGGVDIDLDVSPDHQRTIDRVEELLRKRQAARQTEPSPGFWATQSNSASGQ